MWQWAAGEQKQGKSLRLLQRKPKNPPLRQPNTSPADLAVAAHYSHHTLACISPSPVRASTVASTGRSGIVLGFACPPTFGWVWGARGGGVPCQVSNICLALCRVGGDGSRVWGGKGVAGGG